LLVTPYHPLLVDRPPTELLIEVISPSKLLSRSFLTPVVLRSDVPERQARRKALSSLSRRRLALVFATSVDHPCGSNRTSPGPISRNLMHRVSLQTYFPVYNSVPALTSPRFYHPLQSLRFVHVSIGWPPTQVKAISLFVELLCALPNLSGLRIYVFVLTSSRC
jgi:hypothetical protein